MARGALIRRRLCVRPWTREGCGGSDAVYLEAEMDIDERHLIVFHPAKYIVATAVSLLIRCLYDSL